MQTDKNKDQFFNYLVQERTSFITWIQRKEIAVWSAILFYYAIIWTVFNAIFNENTNASLAVVIFSILTIIVISKVFFIFIHSQFSSIYYSVCYHSALNHILQKIIQNPEQVKKLDYSISKESILPGYIKKEMDNLWPQLQPFRGKLHPLKIFLIFWLGWLGKKSTRTKLSNHNKQEANIYSLILMIDLIFIYAILYKIA